MSNLWMTGYKLLGVSAGAREAKAMAVPALCFE